MLKTCTQLKKEIENGALLVDVRSNAEFNQSHLPGATLIPMDRLPREITNISTDTKLLVYCRSGARSETAARYLSQVGYNAENIGGVIHYPDCLQY